MTYILRIQAKVKTQSQKIKVEKLNETQYIVHVKEPPVEGKANDAVIALLAEYFKVKKNQIDIITGEKAKQKIIEIHFS